MPREQPCGWISFSAKVSHSTKGTRSFYLKTETVIEELDALTTLPEMREPFYE